MKTFILSKRLLSVLVLSIVVILKISAQSAGDYRSIGSGNWNDGTKWEIFDGSNWISAVAYPGQNPGTGAVTIMILHEIRLSTTVPYPIASLLVDQLTDYTAEGGIVSHIGVLTFSSLNAISVTVSGGAAIHGELKIDDQYGAKTHTLFVGGGFEVGTYVSDPSSYCPPYDFIPATFQTISHDDKLSVVFNSSSWINGGPNGIEFQDITFDGTQFFVYNPIYIRDAANFVNGIVKSIFIDMGGSGNADCNVIVGGGYFGAIIFYDEAIVSSASNVSFVDGAVTKWGDDPFIFPIGNEGVYAPLTISPPVDEDESFEARYVRSSGSALGAISDASLYSISNCEHWVLSHNNSNTINYPLEITVGWSSASGCGPSPYISNLPEVTLAHFNGTNWDNHGGSGIGTDTNGSVTWME